MAVLFVIEFHDFLSVSVAEELFVVSYIFDPYFSKPCMGLDSKGAIYLLNLGHIPNSYHENQFQHNIPYDILYL